MFEAFVAVLIMNTEFYCMKLDPVNIVRCTDYIVECILDEGEKNEKWCKKDYIDSIYYQED